MIGIAAQSGLYQAAGRPQISRIDPTKLARMELTLDHPKKVKLQGPGVPISNIQRHTYKSLLTTRQYTKGTIAGSYPPFSFFTGAFEVSTSSGGIETDALLA
jgi:hypothetical protein